MSRPTLHHPSHDQYGYRLRHITTADHTECPQSCGLFRHHAINTKTSKTSAERLKGWNGRCQSSSSGFGCKSCAVTKVCRGNCSNQCLVAQVHHRRETCETLRQCLFHRNTGS